jgi:glycosyltransferase involved in cell wall biosynthesis
MKILVSTFTYTPNVDGVAEAASTMVKLFRAQGHEVLVSTFQPEKSDETDPAVSRFRIDGSPALFRGFSGETSQYLQFIRDSAPDLMVFHGWDTWPVEVAMPHFDDFPAKKIMLSHGFSSHFLDLTTFPRGLWKWLRWLPHVLSLPWRIRRFDRVVFLSEKSDWGRFLDVKVARLTRAPNISIIPNSVPELPATDSGAFRHRHGIGSGPFFLCIANYSTRKNQARALDAFARATLPGATLVFIGSSLGDYGRQVGSMADERSKSGSMGRVLLLEGLDREETISALRDCDVKVLAADAETQPIVLLEAMAAGKPFISTATGCVEEFKGGLVVRNSTEMASAMRDLAENPAIGLRLGMEGRRDYELHYSIARTSNAWLRLLDDLN